MSNVEDALDLLSGLVLEDGRRWGAVATHEQWSDARAVLTVEDGQPPYHWIGRSRGYSKTTDAAAYLLVAMLTQLGERSRSYLVGADRDQAALAADAAAGFVYRTPALTSAFAIDKWRITATDSGATADVLPADAPGSWGLKPSFLLCDEITLWADTSIPQRFFEAISTATTKVPGARLVLISTAGSPNHWSHRIYEHAREHSLWRVSELHGPPPWIDHQRLEEQNARLPESSYRRLFLNEWVEAEDTLAGMDAIRDAAVLDGSLDPEKGVKYVVTGDLGVTNNRSVVAVAHAEPMGTDDDGHVRVVVDRIKAWRGTRNKPVALDEVEEYIAFASTTYNKAHVWVDPWQGIGILQRLRKRGVNAKEFNFSQQNVGRLAASLHTMLRDRRLHLPKDDLLLDELSHVKLKETAPGVVRMVKPGGGRSDDYAVAIALACFKLVERAAPRQRAKVIVRSSFHGRPSPPMKDFDMFGRRIRDE